MRATKVTIKVKNGHLVDFMDCNLLTPTSSKEIQWYSQKHFCDKLNSYELVYLFEEHSTTTRSKKYLHDISSRIAYEIKGSYTTKKIEVAKDLFLYRLSDFNYLDRVPTYNAQLENNVSTRRELFNALRHKAYEMARNGVLDLEALNTYGNVISNFSEHTKYLAKNVYSWTESKYEPRPKAIMTRQEASIIATKFREDRTKRAIYNTLHNIDLFISTTKTFLSKASKVSRTSFYKYSKKWEQLKRANEMLNTAKAPYGTVMNTILKDIEKALLGSEKDLKEVKSYLYLEDVYSTKEHKSLE